MELPGINVPLVVRPVGSARKRPRTTTTRVAFTSIEATREQLSLVRTAVDAALHTLELADAYGASTALEGAADIVDTLRVLLPPCTGSR